MFNHLYLFIVFVIVRKLDFMSHGNITYYAYYEYVYIKVTYTHIWRRQWHPTPVLLPGKSGGRRSLAGCSPWGR